MAVTELTEGVLLALWATLPKRSRVKASLWLRTEAKRLQQPAKKRGPRPASYAKDRQIALLWITYKAQRRNAKADADFAATLPDEFRPKSTRRGGDPYANLMRSIKRDRGLSAYGGHVRDEARSVLKLARDPLDVDQLTAKHDVWASQARSALIGSDPWGSFIQPVPKK